MQSTQYVTLDLNTRSVFSYIRAKQGDSGSRFVCVTLTENGAAYQLPDGVEANFRCLKPDGNSVYNPAVINDDGTITVELTEQVLAVPGVVSSDVCLCDTQGDILSTVSFEIRVDPAPVGTMVASESELLTLLDIIARSEGIVLNMEEINAHIAKTSGNPHKVTAAEVGLGNVPNVATNDQTPTYTQAEEFENLVSGEKLSVSMGKIMKAITVIGGKAPAGYGLGESTGQYVSDCDLALANGWYQTDADTLNTPDTVGSHGGSLFVSNYGTDQTVQTFFEIGYSAVQHILIRRQAWGDWKPWEWVNPPMTVGVEYRTIERYMGKVVYTKLIDCGEAANAATVSLGIDSIDRVCEFFAEADNIISPFGSTASAYYLHIMCDGPRVIIYCGESVVGKQVYVRIKYTKYA